MSLDLATDCGSAGASVPTAGKGRVCLPRRAVTSTEWVTNSSCIPLRPQQQTPARQSRVPAALTEFNDEKLPVTQANACSSFRLSPVCAFLESVSDHPEKGRSPAHPSNTTCRFFLHSTSLTYNDRITRSCWLAFPTLDWRLHQAGPGGFAYHCSPNSVTLPAPGGSL